MPVAGPFHFKWVDADDDEFNPSTHVGMDEHIFNVRRSLIEGEKPMLELEIENPRVGLLSAPRKQWAWFSYDDGSTGGLRPLFFGRLVGNPVQIVGEVVLIYLVADPVDYKLQKQMLAEGMKTLPFYDPIWVATNLRDDPDKILEAYAKLWDVDCISHEVAAVSFTDGSDGNIDLDEDDHFFDSIDTTISQPPKRVIQMDATVQWTQTARGVAGRLAYAHVGLSDTIRTSWPKPHTQLGDGYTVLDAQANDLAHTDQASTHTFTWSWQNGEKHHNNGDELSANYSITRPYGPIAFGLKTSEIYQPGFLDPYATDEDGDPAPVNIPMSYNASGQVVLYYSSSNWLSLQYDAARARTEKVIFRIFSETQPILVDPTVDQDVELVTMNGADVGVPLIDLLSWTTVAGQAVSLGQIIVPDDPQLPGGRSAQICVVAGTAGTTPPDFSDIPGEETVDGGVTWACLGSLNLETYADWTKHQHYNVGDVIAPGYQSVSRYFELITNHARAFPPTGTPVSVGTLVQSSNDYYHRCTTGGITSPAFAEPAFTTVMGSTVTDGSVTWTNIGNILTNGMGFFICVTAGISGDFPPPWSQTGNDTVDDNEVTWAHLGTAEIPIGGVPGQVWAPSFFTQERGHRSIEYLALLLRARHLWSARCVDISFDVDWDTGLDITTRKTVTLHDPRIAGGLCVGKVKSAVLSFGDSGVAVCRVVIGCLVGTDAAVSSDDGTPTYVDVGYVDVGYQRYDNVLTLLPTGSDLNYAPPSYVATDDGLTFPLTLPQVLVGTQTGGGDAGILSNYFVSQARQDLADKAKDSFGENGTFHPNLGTETSSGNEAANLNEAAWVEYELRPVNAGPFHAVVNVKFSQLTMAKGIDLQSEVQT